MSHKSKLFFLAIVLFFSFCFLSCGSKKSAGLGDGAADNNISAGASGYTKLDDLRSDNVKIGVQTGTVFDTLVEGEFPSAKIEYYNTVADLIQRVVSGGIDSFPIDKPVADVLLKENSQITYIPEMLDPAGYAFAFTKNEKGKRLSEQMSELIIKMKSDGTLENLYDVWFGDDESKKIVNIENLPATNGVIDLATESGFVPFCYIRGEQVVGLDIAILEIFCREHGYALNIHDMNFDAVIPSVATRYDIGGSGISITEERKSQVYFSEPYYDGGTVMIVKAGGSNDAIAKNISASAGGYTKLDDLRKSDVKIGVQTGTIFETLVEKEFPSAKVEYYNSVPDLIQRVVSGGIDAFPADKPLASIVTKENRQLAYIPEMIDPVGYAYAFTKNEKGKRLSEQMSELITKMKSDGTLKNLSDAWFGDDESKKTVDVENLPATNGTIELAIGSDSVPFTYISNGQIVGLDIAILEKFCREYGYAINIHDMNLGAIIPSVVTRYDMGGSGISVTEERKEQVYFSEPYFDGGTVMIVKAASGNDGALSVRDTEETQVTAASGEADFLDSIKSSFEKTFVREARWKLIVQGIITTVFISVWAVIFGTVLGFAICMIRLTKNPIAYGLTTAYIRLLQGTPLVVLLMILFYIIFAKSSLSGEWVAIVAFALNFGAYVSEMMRTGIESVDKGQTEAALALGYTKPQAFFQIVMPQAAHHFLPVYKGEFISLVKSTSIVGYIAVQDLTKMSDIIRSRTYEAFFPLIATAIIYFIISGLLSMLLQFIQVKIEPDRKNRKVKL